MKAYPFVSVVILVHNRRPQLKESLTRLQDKLDYPQDQLEIIVVDNASSDKPEELGMDFPDVRWIRLEMNIGISGWNHGFKLSKGDYILVLDDDAHLEGKTLQKAIDRIEKHPGTGILSFHVIDPKSRLSYTAFRPFGKFCCWGCCVLITRDALARTGGFDPGIFLFSHEADFILSLNKAGLGHVHAQDLLAYHRRHPVVREEDMTRHRLYYLAHSMYYTYFKHFHGWRLALYLTASIAICLLGDLKLLIFRSRMLGVCTQAWIDALPGIWHSASVKNACVERDFLFNDIHALPRLVSLLIPIRRWRVSWWHHFYRNRKEAYPEYHPDLLMQWKPISEPTEDP